MTKKQKAMILVSVFCLLCSAASLLLSHRIRGATEDHQQFADDDDAGRYDRLPTVPKD